MSWLKSAVSRAVEVGNKSSITRTVKGYADSVVLQAGQAVAEGAKLFQDRIGNRSYKSAKQTIKRLEDAAVSYRGAERTQLLKRWVTALKEADQPSVDQQLRSSDEGKESPRHYSVMLYYDPDVGGEPTNFKGVFLQSQALEGIVLSMILRAPSEEEITLLLEIFGLCLSGGKEVHNAIVSSIQDLSAIFLSYSEEVLAKREELLQFAQTAISGLKMNTEIGRIDAEVCSLLSNLVIIKDFDMFPGEVEAKTSDEKFKATMEELKKALAKVRMCSRLEELLLKKKSITYGDSQEIHAQKLDKLKVLLESLANSAIKSEKRIVDHRAHKQEVLTARGARATESEFKEKEIETEVAALVKERDELETQLKKVYISLAAANTRLRNAKEEREKFEEANDQILEHLKMKENELSKSIASCKMESNVLSTWISFLEDSWLLQLSTNEIRDKQVNDELQQHEAYFLKLSIHLFSHYKEVLIFSISRIEKFVDNLKNLPERQRELSSLDNDDTPLSPRKRVEEEYLEHEAKIITIFTIVDYIKEQFYAQNEVVPRISDANVKEHFEAIEKLRKEFDAIERPKLEIEILPKSGCQKGGNVPAGEGKVDNSVEEVDTAAELAKLESEIGSMGHNYSTDDMADWEFDELERELKSGGTL